MLDDIKCRNCVVLTDLKFFKMAFSFWHHAIRLCDFQMEQPYVLLHFYFRSVEQSKSKQLAKTSLYYVNSKSKTSKEEVNGCDSQHMSLCIRIALSSALHVLDTRTMHEMLSYFKKVIKWDVGNNKPQFHHVSTIIPWCSKSWFGLVWFGRTRHASDK